MIYKDITIIHSPVPTTNDPFMVVTARPIRCMIGPQGTVKEAPTP